MSSSIKKILVFSLLAAMVGGTFSGCKKNSSKPSSEAESAGKNVKLVVWGSQDDQKMLGEMVESFKKENSKNTYDITLKVVGEDIASGEVKKDISAAADVFAIAHDQLRDLVSTGAVYQNTKYADEIKNSVTEEAVRASTSDGKLYGYPFAQNTYFLYYDKRIFNEEDVKSLDTMLAKTVPNGVDKFGLDFANGYFNSSFFLTNGCTLFGPDGTDETQVSFNNEGGLAAAKYIATLHKKGAVSLSDDEAGAVFVSGKLGAYVGGDWKTATFKEKLGENYAVAELPFIELGSEKKHMKSFSGCKLYCVNAQTKSPTEAMALANYLTTEKNQEKRFKDRLLLPANKKVLESDQLKSDPTTKAHRAQLSHSIPMSSNKKVDKFWGVMKALGSDLFNGKVPESDMQKKLDEGVSDIKS
ncbi:MAG: extracellular solute-binding protein [Oscillospiraceae bacterium]|jgi:arabinogalactan oligomer/maltooligosaccharide transport system substrate-binding protein|nr:extracellular solute-binding protein [Oscillospiraceae bacterium]